MKKLDFKFSKIISNMMTAYLLLHHVIIAPSSAATRTDSDKSINFEDMHAADSDNDNNDVSMCTNWKTSGTVSNSIDKAVISIAGLAAGATFTNALYLRNPCSDDAKVQIRQFEDNCLVDGSSSITLPSGGLSLLTSAFASFAFSDSCQNSMVNTMPGSNVCAPKKTYVVLECLSGGTISAPGGVPPFGEFFYLDPLGNGTNAPNNVDDIYFNRENNMGLYNVYTGDCSDPIVPERTSIYDAYYLTADSGVSSSCNFNTVNGNSCRDAIKAAIQSRRASNWENDPGHGSNLQVHREPANSGISFSAIEIDGFNWGTNESGNFINPIYSNESQCLADQNQQSYSPGGSGSACGDDMVIVLRTTAANETLSLSLMNNFNYNFTVDWGDGTSIDTITAYNDPDRFHTYVNPGDHTVTISGTADSWRSNTNLVEVVNMGGLCWKNLEGAFNGATNLTSFAGGNTSQVTSMKEMFLNTRSLTTADLSSFNTSKVTNMRKMFSGTGLTSLDLSSFDTSNVTDMYFMFRLARSLTSLDLSNFNTSKLTGDGMYRMFQGMTGLTSLNVSNFDTSGVTDFNSLFSGMSSLISLDLSSFDTTNVTDMRYMFSGLASLTSVNLSSFNTSNVERMDWMFYFTSSIASIDLSSFDTTNVLSFRGMFKDASSLAVLDLSNFDTSGVQNMRDMFEAASLTSLNVTGWSITPAALIGSVFYSNTPSLTVYCDQGGSPGTGTFFGKSCN